MNPELALQLKNAGFPQRNKHSDGGSFHIEKDGTKTTIPMLSELIEACHKDKKYNFFLAFGGHFENENLIRKWRASLSPNTVFAFGDTAEEACALLWMELNKK